MTTQASKEHGNYPELEKLDQLGLLRDIAKSGRNNDAHLDSLAPSSLLWGVYPGDGGPALLPAGDTILDFTKGTVNNALGAQPMNIPLEVLSRVQSAIIAPDTQAFFNLDPGYGWFFSQGAAIEGNGRNIKAIRVKSDVPLALLVVVGTERDAPRLRIVQYVQVRYGVPTVVKLAAAGVADALAPVGLVSATTDSNGSKALNQSFAKNIIRTPGWGMKNFLIRNGGAVDLEVQLFGSHSDTVGDAAGWIPDPDTGGIKTVPAGGGSIVLETGVAFSVLQLRARIAAANAAGTATIPVIEFVTLSNTVR